MCCRRWLALPALLALAGCQEGVEVTVTRGADGLLVGVTSNSPTFRACIDQASIFPAGGSEADPIWEAGRTDPAHCAQEVRVVAATPGFAQRGNGALELGKRYCVEVRGPGFGESHAFMMQGDTVADSPGEPGC
jgi:hypothetical protein